jgi:hypothetical protein
VAFGPARSASSEFSRSATPTLYAPRVQYLDGSVAKFVA